MEEIIETFYRSYVENPELHKGLCLFTMGLPASGKTTHTKEALKKLNVNPNNIIHLDPDIILEKLRSIMRTSNLQTLNRQSIIITSKIFNMLITDENQFSIIYYGTGKSWSSYQTMINKAKKNGYTTGLINVILDLETAISRNSLRTRSVGRSVISNIHNRLSTPLTNKKTPKKHLGKTNYEVLSSLVDFVYNIDTTNTTPSILKAKGKHKSKSIYKNKNKKKRHTKRKYRL
jgi:tRNA uridine 5-carbamoylmethylation protein Kti12